MALSRDNIIIVAVFSVAGAVVVLALAARFLARRTLVSKPLPPVQPLAHHREQQLTLVSISVAKNASFASYTDESAASSQPPTPLFYPSASSLSSSHHSSPSFPSTPVRPSARPISAHSNTIRGTPHSRHSQIHIVLPTPLSPDLPSPDRRRLAPGLSRRSSVVDQWISGTAHADGPPSSASNFIIKPPVSDAFRREGVYMVAE